MNIEKFDKYNLKMNTINKMIEEPKKLLNGILNIGFDVSKSKDHCCLIVAQPRGSSETMIINEFYDEKANQIFKMLVGDHDE